MHNHQFLQFKTFKMFWLSRIFLLEQTGVLILHTVITYYNFYILFQEKKRLTICNIARQWEIQQNRIALVASLNQDKDNEPCQINGSAAYVFPEESRYFVGKYFFLFMSCVPSYYSPPRSHCISLSKVIYPNQFWKDVLLHD